MEENPLQEDFSVSDIYKDQKTYLPKMKYILAGVISFIILTVLVFVVIAASTNKGESTNPIEEDEPLEPSNIAEISCVYDVETTSKDTAILREKKKKNSKIYIFINDKRIPYSKSYKFNKTGMQLVKFDVPEDINMDFMFKNVSKLSSVTMFTKNHINILSMKNTFENCQNLVKVNITGYSTEKLISTHKLFFNSFLSEFYFDNFKNNNIQDTSYMFAYSSLPSINLSNFNTRNVTDMSCMFLCCRKLSSIDLSNFYTNNVTNMRIMFSYCTSLTSINLDNFNCDKIETTDKMEGMFEHCDKLNIKNVKHKDFKIRQQLILDLN